MVATADKAVDTSDLSVDPSTKPVLPPLGEGDLTWRRVLAYQQASALADDMDRNSELPKSLLRSFLRPWLLNWVINSSMTTVQNFQSMCGVVPASAKARKEEDPLTAESDIHETYQDPKASLVARAFSLLMSFLANLGAQIGGEIFSITAFPLVFWNVDMQLGRFIIYLWVFSMYIGQSLKDYFHLPRPGVVNAAVRGLEGHWLAEYGFPSTHTMSVMGQACVIVYYTYIKDYAGDEDYPLGIAILLAATVVFITAMGRVYLGVHSIPDILGGFLLEAVIFGFFARYALVLDRHVTTDPDTLYMPTIVCIVLLLVYPKPVKWTNAYGDTSMIAGVGHGVVLGSYFARQQGYPEIPLPWLGHSFMAWAMMAAARLLVGFVLLVVTRQVGKTLAQGLIIRLLPESEVSYKQRYAVGVPVKFITYSLVGFVCVLHGPVLFEALQLNSDTVVAIDKWLLT
eukprot:TRINITY_DN8204_c0_g1_i1.p1 TRINITY_DN8204_c0_g1~~TRINITY_DN8204_c0_g1_i1.p1  ORF type:complete len:456 (+),score=95.21 TRINITY_DN8204_c0_g1_i1:158-1525(+)